MRTFGLIGYPLTHSFSKKYFTEKFLNEGIADCSYELFPIPGIDELADVMLAHPQLAGLNVTIPYKRLVLPYLHGQTEAVSTMQACNCIKITNGKLYGFNTDVIGFEKTFVPHLLPHHTKALILGTGGASSAVAYTLEKLQIEYKFVSRQAHNNGFTYGDLSPDVLATYLVVINTTPRGTYPRVDECPDLHYEYLTPAHYVYDLVYNPAKTLLLQRAEQQGATIENGARMLEIQAEESWRIWNDPLL